MLATKVDPDPRTGDFSGARVRASLEESLERLGLDRSPCSICTTRNGCPSPRAPHPAARSTTLVALRDEGLVDNIGVAGGPVGVLLDYIGTGVLDVVLSHNRYTLLDRSAEPVFAEAAERGMGVVNAAPYGGGMLVKGPTAQPNYAYGQRDEVRDRALAMEAACRRHGVPLAAAALQFSNRDPRIHSTVVGVSSPDRIAQTLALLDEPVPESLWEELAELTPPRELWLDH